MKPTESIIKPYCQKDQVIIKKPSPDGETVYVNDCGGAVDYHETDLESYLSEPLYKLKHFLDKSNAPEDIALDWILPDLIRLAEIEFDEAFHAVNKIIGEIKLQIIDYPGGYYRSRRVVDVFVEPVQGGEV